MSWRSALLTLGTTLFCVSAWSAVPKVLIGEYRAFDSNGGDVTLRVADAVAKELDALGQVEPVVWSMTDPAFRRMAIDNNLEESLTEPNVNSVEAVCRALEPDYYLEIIAAKGEKGSMPIAKLYRGRSNRAIWEFGTIKGRKYQPTIMVDGKIDDKRTADLTRDQQLKGEGFDGFIVLVDGLPDWYSLSITLARTWANQLAETAFKSLPKRPKMADPTLTGGYTITAEGVVVDAPPPTECLKEVEGLIQAGQIGLGTILLRDAIDKYPSNAELRIRMTQILTDFGLYEAAAEEAERAARLSQNQSGLWLTAAKSWFFARQPNRAEAAVNEALARGADDGLSLALIGDIRLLQGDYVRAVEAYTKSLMVAPRPSAVLGRAFAYGLAGQGEDCKKDLEALVDINPESYAEAYVMAVQMADARFDNLADQLRELVPSLRVNREKPANQTKAAMVERAAGALAEMLDHMPVPKKYQYSHRARVLAHKLLFQSASEVSEFAQTGNADLGDEGVLSLGEAMKLIPELRKAFQIERTEKLTSAN